MVLNDCNLHRHCATRCDSYSFCAILPLGYIHDPCSWDGPSSDHRLVAPVEGRKVSLSKKHQSNHSYYTREWFAIRNGYLRMSRGLDLEDLAAGEGPRVKRLW